MQDTQDCHFILPADFLYARQWLALPAPKNPVQATRLLIARRRYPARLTKVLGRNMVSVKDGLDYIHSLSPEPPPTTRAPKRGRGRPRREVGQ